MSPIDSIRPIVRALRSHRAAALLLALEIALTLAVLCNLMFIVAGNLQRARTPTGTDEADIAVIQSIGVIGEDNPGTAGSNLATLQSVPGVAAAAFGAPPLWRVDRAALFASPDAEQPLARPYLLNGSQGLNRTLGTRVIQGRDLQDAELPGLMSTFGDTSGGSADTRQFPALLTQALAEQLYPTQSALGKVLYTNMWGTPISLRVVGVIAPLRAAITGHPDDAMAVVTEFKVAGEGLGGGYMLRSQPGQLAQVLPLAAKALQQANPGHVQQMVKTMAQLREDTFRGDTALNRMLAGIMVILLTVTALGVGGLASFWVQQRTRQIGIRRALGATRTDILRYFQIENFLIVGAGVVAGALLAFALNQWLMQRFELERLSAVPVLIAVVAMWLLGQLAVLGPALRAAAIPPVVATRST
ncbi:FtsX-like permease family protein [Pseudoxanthomonas sp. JBR18]|uniref:ABC transporter permease n=1 Tax=Pseudoxanthomonas sp. JBR18 TaxID=2969308 RepID=UPI0023063826|nr:FtsX-like permease family protein [Pseudoxanthomonas sp. JBR18]WCE02697.1 FtsX-like permease family protein [Pseudoxanthomonas sp. JBR18]